MSYLAEQLLYCDLLRLNLLTGRFVRFWRAFSQRHEKFYFVHTWRERVSLGEPQLCEVPCALSPLLAPLFLSENFTTFSLCVCPWKNMFLPTHMLFPAACNLLFRLNTYTWRQLYLYMCMSQPAGRWHNIYGIIPLTPKGHLTPKKVTT